jgi:hypothetical protein
LIDLALILTSDFVPLRGLVAAVGLLVGKAFVVAGLFAWSSHPDNRVGMLMVATGFAWLLGLVGASDIPLLYAFGNVVGALYFATAAHMLLAAPDGRLHSLWERRLVAAVYVTSLLALPLFLFADPHESFDCDECPENILLIRESETFVNVFGLALNVVGLTLVVAVLVTLVRRWRGAAAPERRLYGPLYVAGVALMGALLLSLALSVAARDSDVT